MPSTPLVTALVHRRLRAALPGVHGGASSLLRLGRGGDSRLPSGAALSGWAERAAAMLDLTPMMVGPQSTPAVAVLHIAEGRGAATARGVHA